MLFLLFECTLLWFTLFQPLLWVTFIEPPPFIAPLIFDTQNAMKLVAELPMRIDPLHIVAALKISRTDLLLQALVKEEVWSLSFSCCGDNWRVVVVQETLFLIVKVLHLVDVAVVLRKDHTRILLAEACVDVQRLLRRRVVDCPRIDNRILPQLMMSLNHY